MVKYRKLPLDHRIFSDSVYTAYLMLLIASFLAIIPFAAFGQVIEIEPDLEEYLAEGLKNNPDLGVWQNKVEAFEHRVPQVGAWSDPTVGLGLMNLPVNSFDFNQEPMTGIWINAGQNIPLAGKTAIKTTIAEQGLESIIHELRSRELAISSALALTWYDWAYLEGAIQTVELNVKLLDNLLIVARAKYETGQGMQQDILRADTKRTQLEDKLAILKQMALTTSRRFASLLGRDGIDNLDKPSDLQSTFSDIDPETLSESLYNHNPVYLSLKSKVNISKSKSDLAKRAWWPDLKLGAGYGFRQNAENGMERPDFFTITAGMSLPIFGTRKQGESVQEMLALERATISKLRSVELKLKFKLDKLLDEDQRLDEQILLYRDGVEPQAEATLAAATSSYSVGKADFEALLMAETALYNAMLERLARVRDRLKVRISIAALISSNTLLMEEK